MNNDFNIEIEDKNGTKYDLVYSNSFTLLNKNDKISIQLPKELNNWTIKLHFEDAIPNKPYHGDMKIEGSVINYYFFGWESDSYVENGEPMYLHNDLSNVHLYSKMRTISSKGTNFRLVIFSLWRKNM